MSATARLLLLLLAGPLLLSSGPAHATEAEAWSDLSLSPKSRIKYLLRHKMHRVEGSSQAPSGRVLWSKDGKVQVMIRVGLDSFDSGNPNRDAHAKEVLETARFPFVTFKGLLRQPLPTSFPAPIKGWLEGELELHGVKRRAKIPFELTFDSPRHATGKATFSVSLEAHGIERPSLMFVKVDDSVEISGELELVPTK